MDKIEDIPAQVHLDRFTYPVAVVLVAVFTVHVIPWLLDPRGLRAYPGPWLAQFSDVWLAWTVYQGHRCEIVHDLHKKHGPFVRLAPNHISVSDPTALEVVYAHGNRATKADFYDAFVAPTHGLFSVRDRAAHARKRKIVSHVFAQKTVLEFEPFLKENLTTLIRQWDRMCEKGAKGEAGEEGEGWTGRGGQVWLNCVAWYGFLAFDIIGDLAFGSPFGMLVAGTDSIPVAKSYKAVMQTFTHDGKASGALDPVNFDRTPAIKALRDLGAHTATVGSAPSSWRPLTKYIPEINKGGRALERFSGIVAAAVAKRLSAPSYRMDVLTKLLDAKDDSGAPLGPEEITAEALTVLVAGSTTTTNTLMAVTYYLAANPRCQTILQQELDEALAHEEASVCHYEAVKSLRYLEAVINESMRLQSLLGLGLPREVPEEGMVVLGRFFPEGTVLSVPSYSLHYDARVWGEDVAVFRPERWFADHAAHAKAFYPFSYGPRACVGRNLVTMEMPVFVASLFRRYGFALENPDAKLDIVEGFGREVAECYVGMRRRGL
ncbi:cytochrome P450 [Amylostereum chailletii]|nr:cytochrome P450 [Amylostereum chailletii]